jgi:hypothetical protein
MIQNDTELQVTLERIQSFHKLVTQIRATETSPSNYHASAGGFLAEIDRMNLEVREYLQLHPKELASEAA